MNNRAIEARDLVAVVGEEERNAIAITRHMKALCDPVRLRILHILAGFQERFVCVTELVEMIGTLSQGTISRHLQVLVRAGFLRCIRGKNALGKQHFYLIESQAVLEAINQALKYTTGIVRI